MLTPQDLHQYQIEGIKHLLAHDEAMLFLDCGLGKSVITLTSLSDRIDKLQTFGVLVVAPLRVCQTVWEQESQKWSHLTHLTFSRIIGTETQRERALRTKADIYLVNYENVAWMVDRIVALYLQKGLYPPFDTVVFDEVTKMKDATTERHTAIRKLLPFTRTRYGLTGTPASNGYKDLFGQFLAIDFGKRLGTTLTSFKETYCATSGFGAFQFGVTTTGEKIIESKIADITLQMSARDYLDLPDVRVNDIWLDMPTKAAQQYRQLETTMFIELDEMPIEVFNAAALTGKCLQAANGALYNEDGVWAKLHNAKLDALEDIIEEASGQPVLCCYEFRSDLERIMKRFPKAVHIGGPMTQTKLDKLMKDWNEGRIPLLVGHPASMGHGLNFQYGGHILVWFGLNWSLELYLQAMARLDRQGQEKTVIVHRLLMRNTLDEAVAIALENKASTQDKLRDAIIAYRRGEVLAAA